MIITVDAHYRSISALAFSDDGACLVSGSEDAGVSVWSIGRCVRVRSLQRIKIPCRRIDTWTLLLSRLLNASPMNPPAPFATLSDHTLPVTDICVGLGPFPQCRIMTASLDSTVKVSFTSSAQTCKRFLGERGKKRLTALALNIADLGHLDHSSFVTLDFFLPAPHLARRVGLARAILFRRRTRPGLSLFRFRSFDLFFGRRNKISRRFACRSCELVPETEGRVWDRGDGTGWGWRTW